MHGLTPKYLVDPVPPLRRHLFGTSIRNELHHMRWRNLRFKNSFYPNAVLSWNNLGPELRQTEKLSTFKATLLGMIVTREKSVFNIHCEDLRFLYQLRVGLSPLKAHKFRHKFIDTPSDVRNRVDDPLFALLSHIQCSQRKVDGISSTNR